MTVSFILNGEDVTAEAEEGDRLVDVLREKFHLLGPKCGCLRGRCGACTVIFNRSIISSCLIPSFKANGGEIVTIEGFMQTDEYKDIMRGFSEASVENCGFCDGAKTLLTESILERKKLPDRAGIAAVFDSVRCRCTNISALVDAVVASAEIRARRLYGRKSQ